MRHIDAGVGGLFISSRLLVASGGAVVLAMSAIFFLIWRSPAWARAVPIGILLVWTPARQVWH